MNDTDLKSQIILLEKTIIKTYRKQIDEYRKNFIDAIRILRTKHDEDVALIKENMRKVKILEFKKLALAFFNSLQMTPELSSFLDEYLKERKIDKTDLLRIGIGTDHSEIHFTNRNAIWIISFPPALYGLEKIEQLQIYESESEKINSIQEDFLQLNQIIQILNTKDFHNPLLTDIYVIKNGD
jgi:hypothetical protein